MAKKKVMVDFSVSASGSTIIHVEDPEDLGEVAEAIEDYLTRDQIQVVDLKLGEIEIDGTDYTPPTSKEVADAVDDLPF